MDLAVWEIVAIAVGSALAGALVSALLGARRRAVARRDHRELRESVERLEAELEVAAQAANRELTRANELRLDRDTAAGAVARLRGQLEELSNELDRERDRAAVSSRELREFKARITDIVGLESENATLRVIAARVPLLERRIAELEDRRHVTVDVRDEAAKRTE